MNKYAAEKIASDYYNMGVQLALQNAGIGMHKTASRGKAIAKALGIGGGAALSPLALHELGVLAGGPMTRLGGGTGNTMDHVLRAFGRGDTDLALKGLKLLPSHAARDAANVGEGIMGGLRSAGGAVKDKYVALDELLGGRLPGGSTLDPHDLYLKAMAGG